MTVNATESRTARWWHVGPAAERWIAAAGLAVVVLAAIGFLLVNKYWPYRYRNVKPLLEEVFASKITIDRYHRIYFPHLGFVAEGLTLRRNTAPDLPPIGHADQLSVEGNWLDLLRLRREVRLVDVKGLHVVIPPAGSSASREDFPPGSSVDFAGPPTTVETLHMQDALLDVVHHDGSRTSYPIRDLALHGVRSGQATQFVVDMGNPKPTGRIHAQGSFGPLIPYNLGATLLSGDFDFAPVNLGDIGTLRGTLSAKGHFSGSLADIELAVTAATPDFAVDKGQPVAMSGSAQCTVNGLNANVVLHTIQVRTGATVVHAAGAVIGSPKVTDLQFDVERGRAQDLLRPFLHDRVPITGVVWLKSRAHIAPGKHGERFLQRLAVDGGFDVPAERLTNLETEKSLTAFSARAQGAGSGQGDAGDPDTAGADAISSLQGQVKIRNGILSTHRLTFQVPGATADLQGTFAFHTGAVHLTGQLKMDADISHAATGFKSVLLKPLAPFFKRKNAGAAVQIAVTGIPHQYHVSQDVFHTK